MATQDVGTILTRFQIRDLEEQAKRLEEVEKQIDRLEGRRVTLKAETQGLSQAQQQMSGLRRSMDQMMAGAQQVGRGLNQVVTGFSKPFTGVVNMLNTARKAVFRFGDGLVHLGQVGAAAAFRMELLLAPIQALGAAAAAQVVDLEHALELVVTQTDKTGEAAVRFKDRAGQAIRDVTNQWAVSADDMAMALFNLISSLNITDEAATALLPTIAKFAVAGDATADEVSQLATVLLATYVPNLDDAVVVTEKLEQFLTQVFISMKQGRGTLQEYVQQIGDFVRIAQEAGAPLPDVLALFAALTRTRPISEAATQVKRLMQTLLTPRFREAAQEMGIAVDRFAEGQENLGFWTDKATGLTKREREEFEKLGGTGRGSLMSLNDMVNETSIRLAKASEGSATHAAQSRLLRERTTALNEAQARYNELLAKSTETTRVFVHTGEQMARPAFGVLMDIFSVLRGMPRPQMLEAMAELFPRIRASLGALEFEKVADELLDPDSGFVTALEAITGVTPEVEDNINRMNSTIQSKLKLIGNAVVNFGSTVEIDLRDRVKGALDLIIEAFVRLQELSPNTRRRVTELFLILSGLPIAILAVSTAIMGAGGLVVAFGALLSPTVLGPGLVLFRLFREQIEDLGGILRGYDLATLNGISMFFGELAVALGLLDVEQVGTIFEKLQIAGEIDPTRIGQLKDTIGEIAEKIERGIGFVERWVDAFGRFFDDIEQRRGLVGGILGQIERIVGFLGPVSGGILEPGPVKIGPLTLEKIDLLVGGFLVKKLLEALKTIAVGVMNVAAGTVKIVGGAGGLFGGPRAPGGPMGPAGPGVPSGPAVGIPFITPFIRALLGSGAASILPPAAVAAIAARDPEFQEIKRREQTRVFQEMRRLLETRRPEIFTGEEVIPGILGLPPVTKAAPGRVFRPLLDEFFALETNDERRNEILRRVEALLEDRSELEAIELLLASQDESTSDVSDKIERLLLKLTDIHTTDEEASQILSEIRQLQVQQLPQVALEMERRAQQEELLLQQRRQENERMARAVGETWEDILQSGMTPLEKVAQGLRERFPNLPEEVIQRLLKELGPIVKPIAETGDKLVDVADGISRMTDEWAERLGELAGPGIERLRESVRRQLTEFGFAPKVPAAGRAEVRDLGPLMDQFQALLMKIAVEGIKINQVDVERLISEFQAPNTSEARQVEILEELKQLTEAGNQEQRTLLAGIRAAVETMPTRMGWPRLVPQKGIPAVPFHTGGYISMLQNEFITSPLTTRLLEGVLGGPLTQNNLRQFAFASATTPSRVEHIVSVQPGGSLSVDVRMQGGNISLTPGQREELGWEITQFVAREIRRGLS